MVSLTDSVNHCHNSTILLESLVLLDFPTLLVLPWVSDFIIFARA